MTIDTSTYRLLGTTGLRVSPLTLGAMMFGKLGNPDHEDSIRIIHRALDAGINIIDTANLHGPQAVLRAGTNSMGFAFAPDGRTVLVANDGDGTVTVIDTAAKRVVSSFKAGVGIETLSYF